ncbi:MAG TPA: tetratricopeptide repeat protein [Bacteroides sp.]|nr:tetratricopeptide repeat protein [Bacteroides sp.]
MSNPDKISRFWQELKRRKVFRVVAMYAGAAYIIIELVNNVSAPLHLPEWVPAFIIVLLAIGFPLVAILSWIFDFTPDGWRRTEPVKQPGAQKTEAVPGKRRLRPSDVIIAALVVIIGILVYPKVFSKDKFKEIRDPEGRISIAVIPFDNQTGDLEMEWFRKGVVSLLVNELGRSRELVVCDDYNINEAIENTQQVYSAGISSSQARKIAETVHAGVYISGSYQGRENNHLVLAKLADTRSGKLMWTIRVHGNLNSSEYIDMTDSLCYEIKNYLEISRMKQKADFDQREVYTRSAQAYKYYLQGVDAEYDNDKVAAVGFFNRAIESDSGFAMAYISLVRALFNQGKLTESEQTLAEARKLYDRCPLILQLRLDEYSATQKKDMHEVIRIKKQIIEMDPDNRREWHALGWAYDLLHQYDKSIEAYEKVLELDRKWGGSWRWVWTYIQLGNACHMTGDHKREREVYQMALEIVPDQVDILFQQAACALSQGDTLTGNRYVEMYKQQLTAKGTTQPILLANLSNLYERAGMIGRAESLIRQALEIEPDNHDFQFRLAQILIFSELNIDEGLQLIDRVLEAEPGEPFAMDIKAWGLYKKEKYEESLQLLYMAWDSLLYYDHNVFLHMKAAEEQVKRHHK